MDTGLVILKTLNLKLRLPSRSKSGLALGRVDLGQ